MLRRDFFVVFFYLCYLIKNVLCWKKYFPFWYSQRSSFSPHLRSKREDLRDPQWDLLPAGLLPVPPFLLTEGSVSWSQQELHLPGKNSTTLRNLQNKYWSLRCTDSYIGINSYLVVMKKLFSEPLVKFLLYGFSLYLIWLGLYEWWLHPSGVIDRVVISVNHTGRMQPPLV